MHSLALPLLALSLQLALCQPPCTPGLDWPGNNVPGSPYPLPPPVAAGAEGQACALLCHAAPACHAFVYFPEGSPGCTLGGGCCFFKRQATLLNASSTPHACGAVMRHFASTYPPTPPVVPPPPGAKNVLYLLVDDLRPELAAYGQSFMSTPSITALAASGALFTRAYSNIAVCSPSRMSFLTGRRPARTQAWNFLNHFRQATCTEAPGLAYPGPGYLALPTPSGGGGQCCSHCVADSACAAWTLQGATCTLHAAGHAAPVPRPGALSGLRGSAGPGTSRAWTTLPQLFYQHGYATYGTGKVFHSEEGGAGPLPWDGSGMPPLQDPPSWSRAPNASMGDVNALAPMWPCAPLPQGCSVPADLNGTTAHPLLDAPFCDGVIGQQAVQLLQALAAARAGGGAPFFLAVGFRKPHLPHRHPAAYDALYPPPASIPTALHDTLDASVPPIAWHPTALAVNPYTPLPRAAAQLERRNYYASVSWMDAQVGRVLRALEASGLASDTVVVLHSDHGWSLGEKGEWEKFTNWEEGVRVPLIVRAPWLANSSGLRLDALAELVDVMPTLAELAGLPLPEGESLDGQSLVPALQAAAAGRPPPPTLRSHALSVYPRCPADTSNASQMWRANDCLYVERSAFFSMGVTLRTAQWRYTEWLPWNGSALAPAFEAAPIGAELYNHTGDDGSNFDAAFEVRNLAEDPAYADVRKQLAALLRAAY
jgi:iduronate 2-sulfatase